MTDTAIVILNYNGEKHLRQFLHGVVKHSPKAEVVVVDNGSTDGSVTYVADCFPQVKLMRWEENLGYAEGYNQALQRLHHPYCLLLNSDVEVIENWLSPMIDWMDTHPKVAACQPKILDFNHKTYFEYAGAAGGYIDTLGIPYCRGRIFDTIEEDQHQYDGCTPIFWASGACMLVRREDFICVGGLDTDFFAHMEEIDLCWRFHRLGKSVYCVAASTVYHVGGGTLHKMHPKKTYLNFRNHLSMIFKNEPVGQLLWKLPTKLILDGLAACKLWKDYSFRHLQAVLRAHLHFYLLLPKNLKKRKEVGKLPHAPHTFKRPHQLLPYSYFVKGKKTFCEIHPSRTC